MRRKSERNKAKATPEKKVEKTTRRTTRRRGKASPSPDRANAAADNVTAAHSEDDKDSRLQGEESNDAAEAGISSSGLIKSVLAGEEEDNGSVWKAARADASPGEIPKLKLCRQRNISEASDSSLSRKKSNKWPGSGEGGIEEADSADEQIAPSKQVFIGEQADDTSSLHPGEDSKEEVSDYTENLPETTSANLSDDKTNIDKQADFTEDVPETTSTNLSEQLNYEENQPANSLDNLPGGNLDVDQSSSSREDVPESMMANTSNSQQNEEYQENPSELINSTATESHESTNTNINEEETVEAISSNKCLEASENVLDNDAVCEKESDLNKVESTENCVSEKEDFQSQEGNAEESVDNIVDSDSINTQKNLDSKEKEEEEEEGEIIEKVEREPSSESDTASNPKNESDTQETRDVESPTETRSSRQKHNKYHESSASDTDSDNEQNNKNQRLQTDTKKILTNDTKEEKTECTSQQIELGENSISCELELSESNMEREDILEINEKVDDLNVSLSVTKPAKVSLKRSFSARLSTDSENKKEESSNKKLNESSQNKENHANNEQPDQKGSTKRRRWGTTTSNDVAPAFSISTDSLKALVPGAKPLSVNELRLSKDEDEEKDNKKSKSENNGEDHALQNDVSKIDNSKKSDEKVDNHISSRRKIIMPKEPPRPKSPSPPEAQATNILLIRNLVRPFTLNQIKELLSRTGTIVENGFWMDRIKSKCFVEYTNEDQAFETRQALHGVSWPLSNPKKLIVEYATKEDMEAARETSKDQQIIRKTEPLVSADLWQQNQWSREERPTVLNKITVIREWDLGKEDGLHAKEKDKTRKEFDKKKRQRSRSPVIEAHLPPPARKFKKKEEEPTTSKLLDDLFRKTKATPCIYWLPLTNEQIVIKEEMRRQHMAEHARRLEEIRRADRSRDSRRRRSPRK